MMAVGITEPGGPDVLRAQQMPVPAPAPSEVLIRVAVAGVNRADVLQRAGKYPVPTGASSVPGLEVAGDIVALGAGVAGWSVGERVCTLTNGGGYAEYATAPAVQLLRWPAGYDATLAACLPEAYFTVWANLFQIGRLQAGETVLVHGGRGGVGTTAIQLARAFGARVFASSGSDQGCRDCTALGADLAINFRREDFAQIVAKATHGTGVDVILDNSGAAWLTQNLACLTHGGRLLLLGFLGGRVAEQVDLLPILARSLTVTGSAMRPRSAAEKGVIAAALLTKVWPLLDRDECRPRLARTFPLARASEAHRLMEAGGYFGKIVLTVGN